MEQTIKALHYALENNEPVLLNKPEIEEFLAALQALEKLERFVKEKDEVQIGFLGCFYANFGSKHTHGETLFKLIQSLPD